MNTTPKRRLMILLVGVLACLHAGLGQAASEGTDAGVLELAPTNVVLITISSLRADHTGSLGYERRPTPRFDSFARQSILFKNAFSTSSWMMPAHGSIFTSLHPSTHSATHINQKLAETHRTLAELLAEQGYYCAGFCCGPRLDRERGFAQGFHLYDDYSVSMILQGLALESEESFDINRHRTNDLVNDAVISWLGKNTHRPFFLFVHYYDNHWDYLPPPPYRDLYDPNYHGPVDGMQIAREPLYSNMPDEKDVDHIVALYDGEVRQTDEDLGEMLDVLDEMDLFDNSIVIVLGDHGEQFYEHGNTSHHGLYDELIHVPLAISFPDKAARGKVVDALVSQLDILPTVLDYLKIPAPDTYRGKSFRPLVEGQVETLHPFVFVEYTGKAVPDVFAVRSRNYKCFRTGDGHTFGYDLTTDPDEQRPIQVEDFTDELRALEAALTDLVPRASATSPDAGQ